METAIVYWGNIGIMEKRMETTIQGLGFGERMQLGDRYGGVSINEL